MDVGRNCLKVQNGEGDSSVSSDAITVHQTKNLYLKNPRQKKEIYLVPGRYTIYVIYNILYDTRRNVNDSKVHVYQVCILT